MRVDCVDHLQQSAAHADCPHSARYAREALREIRHQSGAHRVSEDGCREQIHGLGCLRAREAVWPRPRLRPGWAHSVSPGSGFAVDSIDAAPRGVLFGCRPRPDRRIVFDYQHAPLGPGSWISGFGWGIVLAVEELGFAERFSGAAALIISPEVRASAGSG